MADRKDDKALEEQMRELLSSRDDRRHGIYEMPDGSRWHSGTGEVMKPEALSADDERAMHDALLSTMKNKRRLVPEKPEAVETGELPDDMRCPLHSLRADMDYLVARIRKADDEEAGLLKHSIQSRLSQIEEAAYRMNGKLTQPEAVETGEPAAWRFRQESFDEWQITNVRSVMEQHKRLGYEVEPVAVPTPPAQDDARTRALDGMTRERLGEAIYRALYEHLGGQWRCVETRDVWFEVADRLRALALPQTAGDAR